MSRLIVVSNRVATIGAGQAVGGMAVALQTALKESGGLWFGWSGNTSPEGTFSEVVTEVEGDVALTTIDMNDEELVMALQRDEGRLGRLGARALARHVRNRRRLAIAR